MKRVRFIREKKTKNIYFNLGDKEISKCLLELRVDGLIFDHAAELKDEHSATENVFICKNFL